MATEKAVQSLGKGGISQQGWRKERTETLGWTLGSSHRDRRKRSQR